MNQKVYIVEKRQQKVKLDVDRRERSGIKKDIRFKYALVKEPWDIGGLIDVLAEKLNKKDAQGRLYESTTKNKPFENKDQFFIAMRKKAKISENEFYYWILKRNKEQIISNRFLIQELFLLNSQFLKIVQVKIFFERKKFLPKKYSIKEKLLIKKTSCPIPPKIIVKLP